jgi:predicted dienelactone hydrolase
MAFPLVVGSLLWLTAAAPLKAQGCMAPAVGYRVLRIHGRVTAVWYPTTARPTEYAYVPNFSGRVALNAPPSLLCGQLVPLVVFSHGDLGCGIQSIFFTEELARHGYVVAAPDHADAAICHTLPGSPSSPVPQPDIFKPQDWNEDSRRDRRDDLEAVIDDLLANDEFAHVIDPMSIGAAGHSLGGYTVVGLAGGWASWLDTRVRAVLGLSPYVMPFQVKETLGQIRAPVMYQGGTLDVGITPFLVGPNGAYARANAPAYFLELKNAAHFAWVNCGNEHTTQSCLASIPNARLIDEYSIAFFDHHLKGLADPILHEKNSALANYKFKLAIP